MSWRELTEQEVDTLLSAERIVRVAFAAHGERYVAPLGYVRHAGALWGTTRRGGKTDMARADARVAFGIDDSGSSAAFEWRSCMGAGDFELVDPLGFGESAGTAMAEDFPDKPRSGTVASGRKGWPTTRRSAGASCLEHFPGGFPTTRRLRRVEECAVLTIRAR